MASDIALSTTRTLEAAPEAEDALLAQCRLGDPQAFARLVARHESMVFSLATRLLGDPEEARDASQEVFLQVFRAIDRFEGRSQVKTWIYRIAVNQCRNRRRWWRRRTWQRSCSLEALSAADEARLASGRGECDGPFAGVERRERAARVHDALRRLSFDHRAILLLRENDGLSCEEIAATLQIAEGTVKSRLARAREAFRVALGAGLAKEMP